MVMLQNNILECFPPSNGLQVLIETFVLPLPTFALAQLVRALGRQGFV